MIIGMIRRRLALLLALSISFLLLTSSIKSCNTEDDAKDIVKLLVNNDSLTVKPRDTINLIKFYNAINHRRYYIIQNDIRISVTKVSNLHSDNRYNIYRGILNEDKPFIESLIKNKYQTVPERFISKSCDECSAVDLYKLVVKNSRIKVVDKRELISTFSYWSTHGP